MLLTKLSSKNNSWRKMARKCDFLLC